MSVYRAITFIKVQKKGDRHLNTAVTYKDTVVELNSDLVIKHVAPETQRGVVVLVHKVAVKKLINGGHQATSHQRELIVNETSIQSSNKGSRDSSQEDKADNAMGCSLKALQDGVVNGRGKGL